MGQQTFDFPSGMRVEMRGRSIAEMKATLKAMVSGTTEAATNALTASTVKLVDQGPYPDNIKAEDGGVNWGKALAGDRLAGLVNMRIVSYAPKGHIYDMMLQCKRCPEQFGWSADMRPEPEGDILVYQFEEEARKRFTEGKPSEYTVAGKVVTFVPHLAEHEKQTESLAKNEDDVDEIGLLFRIQSVKDAETGEEMHRNDIRAWLGNLGLELQVLQEAMAEADCGIDTTIDVYCPKCMSKYETALPFVAADFWVPQTRMRDRRQKALARVRSQSPA